MRSIAILLLGWASCGISPRCSPGAGLATLSPVAGTYLGRVRLSGLARRNPQNSRPSTTNVAGGVLCQRRSGSLLAEGERQTMEIQFISPEKVVTSRLSVTLGPALPGQTAHAITSPGCRLAPGNVS